ncbi:MAG: hypothetical protein KDA55_16140, partial [Planctomycetales bacterium]|nr:hypothetical protein [Planctomycetales bacterium]
GKTPGLWQLAAAFPPDGVEWLGPAASRDDVDASTGLRRFGWHFGDFVAEKETATSSRLTRVKLDEKSGAVKSGAMQVIQPAIPPGESAEFTGEVTVSSHDAASLKEAIRWLIAGAKCVPSLGSFRNVGFGRVVSAAGEIVSVRNWSGSGGATLLAPPNVSGSSPVHTRTPRALSSSPVVALGRRLLVVRMHEPFCVGGRRRDRNRVESLRFLPGAVLKGAVAHLLQTIHGLDHRQDLTQARVQGRWERLCRHFSDVRFCSAFPTLDTRNVRPLATPQSLFKMPSDGTVRDCSRLAGPFLVKRLAKDGLPERFVAPAFSPDWKETATPGWDTGWANPDVKLRIRTAIDSHARRVRDEHLFAMELVQPQRTNLDDATGMETSRDDLVWLGTVDLESLPESISATDKQHLRDDLEALFEVAVLRIGKTKARATFELQDLVEPENLASQRAAVDGLWIVTLQSPALLVDPRQLHDRWTVGVDATAELYRLTFDELSGGALVLENHFTDQQLHGGLLAVRGNPGSINQPNNYEPMLTTEAGGVFVLRATNDREADANDCIERWLQIGLPLPGWAKSRYGERFATNPFLPVDGFGEIAVNVPEHLALNPTAEEIRAL